MPDEIKSRPTVTIFGAGVTGLTAAHELAERGFAVVVCEPEEDLTSAEKKPAVGGMARTQWQWLPQTAEDQPARGSFIPTHPLVHLPWEIGFAKAESSLPKGPTTSATLDNLAQLLKSHPEITRLFIEVFAFDEANEGMICLARGKAVKVALTKRGISADRLHILALGNAHTDDRFRSPEERRYVGFRIDETRLPGEHGYRFFPSFYFHLFETMKRIPLMKVVRETDATAARSREENYYLMTTEASSGISYQETGSTAFDNLRPLPAHAIARDDGKLPSVLSRGKPRSMEELRRFMVKMLGDLGCRATDIAIFLARIFKFATACDQRRSAEYSSISWMEFIESPSYSAGFVSMMDKWPHSLVALSARECDAYTHGVITLQLVMDQFRDDAPDRTLVGPTSTAWLEPWKTYLERRHDVVFSSERLINFYLDEETGELSCQSEWKSGGESFTINSLLAGYCVLALPVEKLASVFPRAVLDALEAEALRDQRRNDAQLAVDLSLSLGGVPYGAAQVGSDPLVGGWNVERPASALRHFTGVQYYFEEDINWVEGHTYFIDAPWGISSVTQSAYWHEKMSRRRAFHAIVSVDIGIFDQPGKHGKTAWQCSEEEIARDVWLQIKDGTGTLRLPEPAYYHVDDNLIFNEGAGAGVRENKSPFLVPLKGTWDQRPGEPDAYRVQLDRLVLAGTYMKTYTRLTTMEAANESARHAVNAILEHRFGEHGVPPGIVCATRSMSARESDDAEIFKEIDRELFRQGLPHFMDILKWDTWPTTSVGSVLALLRKLSRPR